MKSTKTFNNISEKLRKEIPKLERGQVVLFQMLHGVPNPEPDDKERAKAPTLYGKRQIPTTFRIFDPYQKDETGKEVGGYVDVGCVDTWNGNDPLSFRRFIPGEKDGIGFDGKFQLEGGKIQDEELYEILWLSNERKGNPHRDQSVEEIFEIVDLKQRSKATISRVETLQNALTIAKEMPEEKAKQVMAALNQPDYQDAEVLRAKVRELAATKPEDFLKAYNDPKSDTRYIILQALNNGVLSHDFATGVVKIGNTKVGEVKVTGVENVANELMAWLESAANGKDMLANIKNQLYPIQDSSSK